MSTPTQPALTALLSLMATPTPADLGPGPRNGVTALSELRRQIDQSLSEARLTDESAELIRATLFLWHDHHDASHSISQDIDATSGSLVHGILHRREPDYWNSKYWFRRVGPHPVYPEIAKRVKALLDQSGAKTLAAKLVPTGNWDVFAFVDVCEATAGKNSDATLLRDIQRIETEVLLEHFLTTGGSSRS
ncbi:MAG TPA: hypothetical protein VK968_00955 [Roseimicrobium sp.]|nr:hypothetical protein [Roseimicrobium sp.]